MFALSSSPNYIPIEYKNMIKKMSHLRPIYLKLLCVVELKNASNHGVYKKAIWQ